MSTMMEVIAQKVLDLNIPGHEVSFDPEEAEALGAFVEDALDEQTARDASIDLTADLFEAEGK